MNARTGFRAAAFSVAVIGLGAAPAAAQPRMPTHVACVGDSITVGTSTGAYPADLQILLGGTTQVANFGHSGATMLSVGDLPYQNQPEYTQATTFVSNAGAGAVVDVILMLGTNDTKSYNWMVGTATRATQFATDCAAMIDHFASLPTQPVVYLALPLWAAPGNAVGINGPIIHDQILPILQQIAAQKGIPLIDLNTPSTGHPEYLVDGVHPTDAGYQLVAQWMRDGIQRVPRVSLTSPAAGNFAVGAPIAVAADASGDTVAITSVEFFQGVTSLGRVTQAPFGVSWPNAAAGAYTLTAKATDTTGAAATSAPVAVTVGAGTGGAGRGGGGGAGGATTTGGGGTGGAGTGGAPVVGGGAGGTPTSGTGGRAGDVGGAPGGGGTGGTAGAPGASSGGGCSGGCRLTAGRGDDSGILALAMATLALALIRSRRRR